MAGSWAQDHSEENNHESDCSVAEENVKKESWASVLGRSAYPAQNKNVLEVILEKDTRGAFVVSDIECARLINKLGPNLVRDG